MQVNAIEYRCFRPPNYNYTLLGNKHFVLCVFLLCIRLFLCIFWAMLPDLNKINELLGHCVLII